MNIGSMPFINFQDTENIKSPFAAALESAFNTKNNMQNFEKNAAEIKKLNAQANMPFGGASIPGPAGKVIGLETLRQFYGENSPQYQSALKSFNLGQDSDVSRINYQNALRDTMGLRYTTPQGRSLEEESNVNQGYSPSGTPVGAPVVPGAPPYNPNANISNAGSQYELARAKGNVPATVLQKNLLATNIEKTLNKIDENALTQYGGLRGGLDRLFQKGAASVGKESKDYDNHLNAKQNVELLTHQVRQFYGDSIQPEMLNRLQKLNDPATWTTNPKIAKELFDTTKDILKQELQTYRSAFKGTGVYSGNETSADNSKSSSSLPEGQIQATAIGRDGKQRVKINGQWYKT